MACWVWGNTIHGELGLGGIEEDSVSEFFSNVYKILFPFLLSLLQILSPRVLLHDCTQDVEQVACGISHTVWLTKEGKVFSCGNNDNGQLGHGNSWKKPRK